MFSTTPQPRLAQSQEPVGASRAAGAAGAGVVPNVPRPVEPRVPALTEPKVERVEPTGRRGRPGGRRSLTGWLAG